MSKQLDGMYSVNSYTDLTVFRTGKVQDGKELVITCGYTNDGRFGYFIVDEQLSKDGKTNRPMWKYSNQRAFFQKKNEQAYKDAIDQIKGMIE